MAIHTQYIQHDDERREKGQKLETCPRQMHCAATAVMFDKGRDNT